MRLFYEGGTMYLYYNFEYDTKYRVTKLNFAL